MARVDRTRRSAKGTIETLADELLARRSDPDVRAKLVTIETIAYRMGWTQLYEKLRWKSGLHQSEPKPEQWWQR